MPTTVSLEPEFVKFGPDHSGNQAEEQNPPSSAPERDKRTGSMPPSGLRKKIEELFAIDLRSLALTRVATALLVLLDLAWRSTSLTAFYSDRGVVPRVAVYERLANSWELSLHLMSGRVEVQALLFVISGIFALMLLVGFKTRSASFWTWLLFTSLNSRNFYVVHGGDSLLNMLLFWGMFVPWGAKYSVDSALNSSSDPQLKQIVSIGTAAFLLQMPLVYFFGGILKNGPEWRQQFTAIYYVLSAPDYATSMGHWMASWPMPILQVITASIVVLEISGAVLLFCPLVTRTIRSLVLPAFLLLQIGLAMTMKLGLFPLISTAAILPFIPGWLWEKLYLRLRTPSRTGLRIYFDEDCKFCRKAVRLIKEFCLWPDTFVGPAQARPEIYADMQLHNSWVVIDHQNRRHLKFEAFTYIFSQSPLFWFPGVVLSWPPLDRVGNFLYERVARNRGFAAWLAKPLRYRPVRVKQPLILSLVCAFFLAYVLLDNLGGVKRTHLRVPDKLGGIGQMLRIHQRWRMFAPSPLRVYEWYLVEGRLLDGEEVCFVNGVLSNCQQSGNNIPSLKSYRWRTYWRYVGSESAKELRPYLARYICNSWNSSHSGGKVLDELAIFKLRQAIRLDGGKEQPEKIQLWKDQCFAKDGTSGSKTEQFLY
jgi:predicted DCC family thiol-disulfide oxidoreductase YuxK